MEKNRVNKPQDDEDDINHYGFTLASNNILQLI
jgi:hypothetical protein